MPSRCFHLGPSVKTVGAGFENDTMTEAVAIFGLVAAIIEISSFAKRLVDRCKEFHSNSKDVPKGFRAISVQLPLVVSSLEQIRGQAESGALGNDSLMSLRPVIEACHEEVKDLEVILKKILPAPDASSWDRNTLALKSLRFEVEVRKSIANLSGHVQYLTLFQTCISTTHVVQQLRSHGDPLEVSFSTRYKISDSTLTDHRSLA